MQGGKRGGAGRPKGSPNKATAQKRAEIEASGLTPLDFMLGILRDEERPTLDRFEAAKAAAPYVHARLSAVEAAVKVTEQVEEVRWSIVDPEPVDP